MNQWLWRNVWWRFDDGVLGLLTIFAWFVAIFGGMWLAHRYLPEQWYAYLIGAFGLAAIPMKVFYVFARRQEVKRRIHSGPPA